MEITIRRAISTDALFLTSISFGAKRYWNYSEEYLEAWHDELTISEEYIEKNVVFVAQKKATIIGYCSMIYREEDVCRGETKLKAGYWLDHIFIRPAYIGKGIGSNLIEALVTYCEGHQVNVFNILSNPHINSFYEKIGATYVSEIPSKIEGSPTCLFKFVVSAEEEELQVSQSQPVKGEKLDSLDDFKLKGDELEEELGNQFIERFKCTSSIGYKFQCEEEVEARKEQESLEKAQSETEDEVIEENSKVPDIGEMGQAQEREESLGIYETQESEEGEENKSISVAEAEEAYHIEHSNTKKITKEYISEDNLYEELQDMLDRVSENQTPNLIRSEKEKMLQGEEYIAWGDEIVEDRKRARKLLKEFNLTDPEDKKKATKLLKELFGQIGEYVHIEPDFKCNYGYNIHIGDNFYAGYNCVILDNAKVSIGDNCIISPQVGIYTLAYPTHAQRRLAGYEYAKPVVIGNNVWIGGGTIINPGVTIGNDVVIAPGSVIISDIPDHVVVGGNPAKIIKEIDE